jgi:di/tricarboxylate transporter
MTKSGAAGFVSQWVVLHLAGLVDQPTLLVIGLVVAVALIHLAITNLAACIALLIPVAATIAERAALNPVVCGLIVTIVVDAVILYPIQTATNLLAYETGYYGAADVRRLGIGMLLLSTAIVLLTIPYWGLFGLPLTLR